MSHSTSASSFSMSHSSGTTSSSSVSHTSVSTQITPTPYSSSSLSHSISATSSPWTFAVKWSATDCSGLLSTLTATTCRLESWMPKRRNDSAIYILMSNCWIFRGPLRLTLLFGDSEKTTSEWTLRLFSRSDSESEMALKQAASTWLLESRTEASKNAYSKSELPSSSCWRRKPAFWTFLKRPTWIGESGR